MDITAYCRRFVLRLPVSGKARPTLRPATRLHRGRCSRNHLCFAVLRPADDIFVLNALRALQAPAAPASQPCGHRIVVDHSATSAINAVSLSAATSRSRERSSIFGALFVTYWSAWRARVLRQRRSASSDIALAWRYVPQRHVRRRTGARADGRSGHGAARRGNAHRNARREHLASPEAILSSIYLHASGAGRGWPRVWSSFITSSAARIPSSHRGSIHGRGFGTVNLVTRCSAASPPNDGARAAVRDEPLRHRRARAATLLVSQGVAAIVFRWSRRC